MNKILNALTPKRIIFDALKEKLEGTGITKIVFVFKTKVDEYNVMICNKAEENLKLNIEAKEVSMLKKMFVSKVQRKVEQEFKKDFTALIFVVKIEEEEIEIFVEDIFNDVTKFEY